MMMMKEEGREGEEKKEETTRIHGHHLSLQYGQVNRKHRIYLRRSEKHGEKRKRKKKEKRKKTIDGR